MEEENPDVADPLPLFFFSSDDPDLAPPLSLPDQIIQINFEAPLHHHHAEEEEGESFRAITLSLSLDAGPGCGGIAWPAGEVHSFRRP